MTFKLNRLVTVEFFNLAICIVVV